MSEGKASTAKIFWFVCFQYCMVSFVPEGDDSCSDEEIEVVPSTWLTDGDEYAFWPTISSKGSTTDKRTRLIMSLADPQPEWPKRKIRLRHSYGELS